MQMTGFRMVSACASGTSTSSEYKTGMDSEENKWYHYNEFVFCRPWPCHTNIRISIVIHNCADVNIELFIKYIRAIKQALWSYRLDTASYLGYSYSRCVFMKCSDIITNFVTITCVTLQFSKRKHTINNLTAMML